MAKLYKATIDTVDYKSVWTFVEDNVDCLQENPLLVSPGLGRLTQAGLNSEHGVLQFALLVAGLGGQGNFEIQLTLNHTVFFDCQLIDVSSIVRVQALVDEITISTEKLGKPTSYVFQKRGASWKDVTCPEYGVHRLKDASISLFTSENSSTLDERVTAIFPFSKSTLREVSDDLTKAFALIEKHAPEYLEWVGSILRGIVFLGPTDGSTISHSSELRPGLVAISHPIDIPHFAAQIVHESAHQYFFMFQHENVLTDFESETLYASPLREEGRPLVLSLLALHASVNIRKLVILGLAGGVRSGYFESELVEMNEGIQRSILSMAGSPDFTTPGRIFFEDICRLAEG